MHMVNYETDEPPHSVTGSLQCAADLYTYAAGVHIVWHHWQERFFSDTGHFVLQSVDTSLKSGRAAG